MIEDVAVADVMQLVRLGGHSGTLTVNNGREEGFVGFEHGRVVSAWNPRTLRLGELLVAAGAIDEGTLVRALEAQNTERPRRSIGQILVRMGATTGETIRDIMAQEIERVVGEILAWKSGTFEFVIDDLTPLVEVTRFTGAPKVDLDIQTVLMEALRRMEDAAGPAQEAESRADFSASEVSGQHVSSHEMEAARAFAGQPVAVEIPGRPSAVESLAFGAGEPAAGAADDRPRLHIVSPDTELVSRLNLLLTPVGNHIASVALRDAGASLLGEAPPIVVVDLRHQPNPSHVLATLCRSRPRASIIALFEGRAALREMYEAGVLSVTSKAPETVVACILSVARQRKYLANEHAVAEGVRASFARLRRILADLRSGLLGTSVSTNLMAAVAESLDRGVLFVPHLDRLVALGAFGKTGWGAPLAKTTQGLILSVASSGVFKECIDDGRSRRLGFDHANLPQAFLEAVDRPRTGEIAVLPVPGSERVIAAIYLDNGTRERPIGDIEIFELAAFQLGLALENEFLRRASTEAGPGATSVSGAETG